MRKNWNARNDAHGFVRGASFDKPKSENSSSKSPTTLKEVEEYERHMASKNDPVSENLSRIMRKGLK